MNEAVYPQLALWVAGAIALVVVTSYFARPRTRALFPGGPRRYLLALVVQSVAFMAPIPIVLVFLVGQRLAPGLDVIIAVSVGFGVLIALRALPVTGPLLKDLHRARLDAAMQRLERRP
ncbi:MAG: hypothetical protein K2X34_03630 [Hyphomonadaceae bacterium]|nr:hypothetical protein [Hyphomonadaceae bacterium]